MKKVSFLLILTLMLAFRVNAQTNPEVFGAKKLIWAGLDFSKSKMIGSTGFTDESAVKNEFFDKWNQLIVIEADKYDLAKTYQKDKVVHDLSVVNQQNQLSDDYELVINESYKFNEGDIEAIVKNYDGLKEKDGVGLLYVIEYFSKLDEKGSMYVVFFDPQTLEVLHSQNYVGKPGGFGLRNFWAKTVAETMELSGKDYKKAAKAIGKK
ncbi:MAG: hypothetical protein HC819_06515 [Cyclobacteriaceae bacterium]|nr:hypothetical protein [Cyclobacteriaceae bacterium]